jgi:hypothetical protein
MLFDLKKPHWIILGPKESWQTAFKEGCIWGVKEVLYPEWKALEQGDIIFFHITKTIGGVIGVGRVQTKFIQHKPLWPDEIREGKVLYPLRFEFDVDYLIEEKDWKNKKISAGLSIQEMRRGINLLQERTVQNLYKVFVEKFNHTIQIQYDTRIETTHAKPGVSKSGSPDHTRIQEMIFEIGKLNRLVSEKEYPMDDERLDVVWRRVERSAPTYVFEVQVGGDLYHALGKLKHAFDLWNSRFFLVASEEDIKRAKTLLAGTFHEIRDKIKILSIEKISELYQKKRSWTDIEKEVGLL